MSKINNFIQGFKGLFNSEPVQKQIEKEEDLVAFSVSAAHDQPERPTISQTATLSQYRSYVYASIRKRSENVSKLDLKLFKKLRSGSENSFKEITVHPILDLLDRVNPFITFVDLIKITQTYKDLCGEAFWWIIKANDGTPLEIYPFIRPDLMEVATSREEFISGYVYNEPGTGQQIPFDPSEIIHFKYFNPTNPYRGYSPIKAAEVEVSTYNELSEWNWRFFKNNAKPSGVIEFAGTIKQDQIERIKTQWAHKHQGVENAHRLAVLGNGATYKEIGFSQKEMDFQMLKNLSRDDILACMGVPLAVISPNESINRATADVARDVFWDEVVLPLMDEIVLALNEFLLPMYNDDTLIFDKMNTSRENVDQKLATYANGIANGWLSPNEVRQSEKLEPYENGDNLYLPFNVQAVGNSPEINKSIQPTIKFRRRSDKEIKQEQVHAIIKEQFKKELKPLVKKKLENDKFEKNGLRLFQRKEAIIKQLSKRFKDKLRKEFDKQRSRINGSTKYLVDFDFDLSKEVGIMSKALTPEIKGALKAIYIDSLRLMGIDDQTYTPNLEDYVNDYGMKYITTINKTTLDGLNSIKQDGITKDKSKSEILQDMNGFFVNTIYVRAATITDTELQRMYNWATNQSYIDSGVVSAKQWWTAEDERVCDYCAPLHGKIVEIEDNFFDRGAKYEGRTNLSMNLDYSDTPAPPLHTNCRCTIVPITIPISEQKT